MITCIQRHSFPKRIAALWFGLPLFGTLSFAILPWDASTSAAGAQGSGDAIYGVTSLDEPPSATSQGRRLLASAPDVSLRIWRQSMGPHSRWRLPCFRCAEHSPSR